MSRRSRAHEFADLYAYLWVLEGNERARRFYERHGWVSDEVIKSFEVGGAEVPEIRHSRRVESAASARGELSPSRPGE